AAGVVDVGGAAARRPRPGRLRPTAFVGVADQRGAAHGGDELGRARIAHAADQGETIPVAVVARGNRDRDAGVLVETLEVLLAGELPPAPVAVRDGVRAEGDGRVDARAEVQQRRAACLDQEAPAGGGGGAGPPGG